MKSLHRELGHGFNGLMIQLFNELNYQMLVQLRFELRVELWDVLEGGLQAQVKSLENNL